MGSIEITAGSFGLIFCIAIFAPQLTLSSTGVSLNLKWSEPLTDGAPV
jgi:hypothetical protein